MIAPRASARRLAYGGVPARRRRSELSGQRAARCLRPPRRFRHRRRAWGRRRARDRPCHPVAHLSATLGRCGQVRRGAGLRHVLSPCRRAGRSHGRSASAIGRLLAAGALAGLAGPILAQGAEQIFLPYTLVGTSLVATLAQLGVLTAAVLLPAASRDTVEDFAEPAPASRARDLVLPTLIGASAWAAMASSMVAAPLGLATCGVAVAGVSGIVAWHVVAMYAPALAAGMLAERLGIVRLAMAGASMAVAAALAVHASSGTFELTVAFLSVGAGWSVTTSATSAWIHRLGTPARAHLAFHDGLLLVGRRPAPCYPIAFRGLSASADAASAATSREIPGSLDRPSDAARRKPSASSPEAFIRSERELGAASDRLVTAGTFRCR